MDPNRVWPHLNAAQADGLACVMCATPTSDRQAGSMPVGRSDTGSQVFACSATCARQAGIVVIDPEP